jgi:hypothetical protein
MPTRIDRRYHVSPAVNRASILTNGLDWRLMPKDAPGIAGGHPGVPEEHGIFLSYPDDSADAMFFVRMGSGRLVDVWEVDVAGLVLEPGPDGWFLCRTPIDPSRLRLVETWQTDADVVKEPRRVDGSESPVGCPRPQP